MITESIEVTAAGAEEWRLVRGLRLGALAAEPQCFGVAADFEASKTEDQWRRTLISDTWLLARVAGAVVGMVAFFPADTYPDGAPQLGAMWVHQCWRGRGISVALTAGVEALARDMGARSLGLWVNEGNDRALRTYERLGYTTTAATKPAPRDRRVSMQRLLRVFADSP